MLNLNVTADNYAELKSKAFSALGLTDPPQKELPLQILTSHAAKVVHATAIPAQEISSGEPEKAVTSVADLKPAAAPAPRVRRTKAEIEAERQAKNKGASHAETVENNFKAGDEHAANSDEVEDINAGPSALEMEANEGDAPTVYSEQDRRLKLRELIKHVPSTEAEKLLASYGTIRVSTLADEHHQDFMNKADAMIAEAKKKAAAKK